MGWTKDEKLVAGIAAAGVGTALYFIAKAATAVEEHPPRVPDAIEARIETVVAALNKRFGKVWVVRGLAALKTALSAVLPTPLVVLADSVYAAEHAGRQNRWSGAQKLNHAVRLARA